MPLWLRALFMVSRPLAIVPVATVVAVYFSRYSPEQITGLQEMPLFLQGNTDYGGSNIFSATIALYVTFGLLAAIYVTLQMHVHGRAPSYLDELRRNLWELRFHVFFFVVGGTACWTYDSFVAPNDFRNMFLFAIVIYSLSVVFVTTIGRTRRSLWQQLMIAHLVVYAWLWLGWDGNTAKAGQILNVGQTPVFQPRSYRHRIMLAWHQACERVLGDH
jgi:hypothetical protein